MECRSRTSPEQFAALLEFMESHGDIARPQKGVQGRIKADRLWQQLMELLNSVGGGNPKSIDKWKKVWADWKAKTKKKALTIRNEASGTGGGPSSRQTLTAPEERLLGIMGLTAVVGQVGIEERGFDEQPTQIGSPPTPTRDTLQFELSPQTATDDVVLDFVPTYVPEENSTNTAPSQAQRPEVSRLPSQTATLPFTCASTQMSSASSIAVASRGAPQRRQHPPNPSLVASPTRSTPQRRRLHRARTRRVQTPFERATSEFVAIENRRLQFEEDREKNHFQLESRRIELDENRNQTLNRLTCVLEKLTEILQSLRPSSLPSTDIL